MPFRSRSISRRDFLVDSAAAVAAGSVVGFSTSVTAQEPALCTPSPAGKPPIPFKPDTTLKILPRRSAATLTPTEITRLRAAYQALRDLRTKDSSDPRGWMHQANVHCWNCGGGLKDTTAPEIHGGWLFLPWHRAYLYSRENSCGSDWRSHVPAAVLGLGSPAAPHAAAGVCNSGKWRQFAIRSQSQCRSDA